MGALLWAAPAMVTAASMENDAETTISTAVAARRQPEILNKTEMLSLVKKYAADIADSVLDAERQRERAIRETDSIKLSCIQDRLSNMKSMKKMADDRFAATQRPRIQADDLNLRHEFRGVELAHARVIELHKELLECVGENLEISISGGAADERGVSTGTDPAGTNIEIPKIDRPAPASAYQ